MGIATLKRSTIICVLALPPLITACSNGTKTKTGGVRPASTTPSRTPAPKPDPSPSPGQNPATSGDAKFQGTPNEAVWHLRAALNVAALSCRGNGRAPVKTAYAQLLKQHSALLASAYQSEQSRYGVVGLDRHQTQLYNRYALQRSPEKFCRAAANIASRATAMNSSELAPAAARLLEEIDQAKR